MNSNAETEEKATKIAIMYILCDIREYVILVKSVSSSFYGALEHILKGAGGLFYPGGM